eukprot:scaffold27600_cov124-Isochrysis_galbana.AAC.10
MGLLGKRCGSNSPKARGGLRGLERLHERARRSGNAATGVNQSHSARRFLRAHTISPPPPYLYLVPPVGQSVAAEMLSVAPAAVLSPQPLVVFFTPWPHQRLER